MMNKGKNKTYKQMEQISKKCSKCGRSELKDSDVKSFMCSRCVDREIITEKDLIYDFTLNIPGTSKSQSNDEKKTSRPVGWHFMAEFVDEDGTVFFKGVEQPELKGTKPITNVESKKNTKKQNMIDDLSNLINEKKELFGKIVGFYYNKKGDHKKISHIEKKYKNVCDKLSKIYRTM